MTREPPIGVVSRLSRPAGGVFRGRDAVAAGLSRQQLGILVARGAVERVLPDTYVIAAVAPSVELRLRAALLWAGPDAAGAGLSAGQWYRMEGVRSSQPEIAVLRSNRPRTRGVVVTRPSDPAALMIRMHNGIRVTGPEATLVRLAHLLDGEALEVACEHARRRRLTSVPALRAYLEHFGASGRPGVAPIRALLRQLDPSHPSRSTLEVKTRRLLVARHLAGFVREFPLEWNGKTYWFDFAFLNSRTILETNGKRWHDDPIDYEYDNEKWSVPGRHALKLVMATWRKVTRQPDRFVAELRTTLAA